MLTAKIDASSSGDNTIVSAVAGRRIRVYEYVIVANAAVVVKWRSDTTDISGPMNLAAAGYGISTPASNISLFPVPKLMTATGEALKLNLGSAVQVGGHMTYDVVD